MSVTVTLVPRHIDDHNHEVTHAAGEAVELSAGPGHLYVTNRAGATVAVHAAGEWRAATITTTPEA